MILIYPKLSHRIDLSITKTKHVLHQSDKSTNFFYKWFVIKKLIKNRILHFIPFLKPFSYKITTNNPIKCDKLPIHGYAFNAANAVPTFLYQFINLKKF